MLPINLKTTFVPTVSTPSAGITDIRATPMHYDKIGSMASEAYDYQRDIAGMLEFEISGNGESVWADGVDGDALIDAKYVTKPQSSPYTGTVPDFIIDTTREELRRYGQVIADPRTRYTELQIVTNNEEAATFLGGLMAEYGVPGRTIVRP